MSACYDVVMPILKKDWPAAQANLPFVFKNLPVKRLIVLSGPDIQELLPKDERIVFVNENELLPGLTIGGVKDILNERILVARRAGWYFQQFLKMAYSLVCEDEAYIVWDADTIPVRPIRYTDEEGKFLFTLRYEPYNKPYFDTLRTILNIEKQVEESFIVENMIFETSLMRRMIAEIEDNKQLAGENFWQKILYAVEADALKASGFSEFETYGTWVTVHHPGRYATRHLETLRSGKNILGEAPGSSVLEWAAGSYDTVSMEKFSTVTPLAKLAESESYRAKHSAAELQQLKERFKVIPAVYGWATGLWPRFKIWGGKYKRKIKAMMK